MFNKTKINIELNTRWNRQIIHSWFYNLGTYYLFSNLQLKLYISCQSCRSYNGTPYEVLLNPTQPVNAHLTSKYDIHFNFFLTKPTNEIIYNHTAALTTISFKDTVILAYNNEYLKRYYFLKNTLDKDQIYDRINLLAQFYGNAVLLRYEYPLMILTRTKSIFLKRLKRMKKVLVQQGSSDQSKSNIEQKAISINSSQFLLSINSSELEKKSLDDDNIQLDFSLFRQTQYEIHDVYGENQSNQTIIDSLFFTNINRLTRQISFQLNLQKQPKQQQIKHLVVDFDEFDRQEIIKNYQRLMQKQNCKQSSKQSTIRRDSIIRSNSKNPVNLDKFIHKKPLTSSITITALQDHMAQEGPLYPTPNDNFKKKSMMSPRAGLEQKGMMKRSSYYQYQMDHKFLPNRMVIAEDEIEELPNNMMKKIKKYPSMNQQDFNFYKNSNEKQAANKITKIDTKTNRQNFKQRISLDRNPNQPKMKYSSILASEQPKYRDKIFSTEFQKNQFYHQTRNPPQDDYQYNLNQKYKNIPYDSNSQPRYSNLNPPSNRMTSINININNLEEKKDVHRVNVKVNNPKNKLEQFAEEQRNYRVEKKKKIREKAAALLNRVKSQEYMRTGYQNYDKNYQYDQSSKNGQFFQRYYG